MAAAALFLWCLASPAAGSPRLRIRIANTQYGAVDVSIDDGATWRLVARVMTPALDFAPGPSTLPTVQRLSERELVFGVGSMRALTVAPGSPKRPRSRSTVILNAGLECGIFGVLAPPVGSPVQLVQGRALIPFYQDYTPADGDVFVITAESSSANAAMAARALRDAALAYQADARRRYQSKPISGNLTVTGRTVAGEGPTTVAFFVDGEWRGATNVAPYRMKWDTHQWSDGEHLIEIRARDAADTVTSRTKTLVFVENTR